MDPDLLRLIDEVGLLAARRALTKVRLLERPRTAGRDANLARTLRQTERAVAEQRAIADRITL